MLLVNDSFNFCLKLIPYFLLQLTAGGIRHELPFWYTDFETFLRCQRQPFPHECLFRCVFGKCHTLFSSFLHTFFNSGRLVIHCPGKFPHLRCNRRMQSPPVVMDGSIRHVGIDPHQPVLGTEVDTA